MNTKGNIIEKQTKKLSWIVSRSTTECSDEFRDKETIISIRIFPDLIFILLFLFALLHSFSGVYEKLYFFFRPYSQSNLYLQLFDFVCASFCWFNINAKNTFAKLIRLCVGRSDKVRLDQTNTKETIDWPEHTEKIPWTCRYLGKKWNWIFRTKLWESDTGTTKYMMLWHRETLEYDNLFSHSKVYSSVAIISGK